MTRRKTAATLAVYRGDLPEPTAAAAFEPAAPGFAGPVDTGFGFTVIDIAAITPAEVTPFEERQQATTD